MSGRNRSKQESKKRRYDDLAEVHQEDAVSGGSEHSEQQVIHSSGELRAAPSDVLDTTLVANTLPSDPSGTSSFILYKHIMGYISVTPQNVRSLLISAVQKGNIEIIGQILDAGVDVNEEDASGMTPLMASPNREVVQFLIQRGADVNHVTRRRYVTETPLIHMINRRKCMDVSTVELCKVLVDNGASVNCKSGENKTPLMIAASEDNCVGMLQMLLDNGADVNDKDNEGNTALLHAVTRQYSENVSCLIGSCTDRKSLVNIQNKEGLTPLIVSVVKCDVNIIKELIVSGADVNMRDTNENTVLHHLIIGCHWSIDEVLKILVNAGSDVNCQNSEGLSPLMLAAKKSTTSVMSSLLDAGAEVNAVSNKNNSNTALSFLQTKTYLGDDIIPCLETLLDRGASSSYLNPEVLHQLITQSQTDIIPKLIQHGLGPADVKAYLLTTGKLSVQSPLCAALLTGNVPLARYFVDILFLTSSDLSMFACNKAMERLLETRDADNSLNYLQELSSQPMSLVRLSLVAVSSAVCSSPGRESRVHSLPLPAIMKDRLLFKSEDGQFGPSVLPSESNSSGAFFDLARLLADARHLEVMRYLDSDDADNNYNFLYINSDFDDDYYVYSP